MRSIMRWAALTGSGWNAHVAPNDFSKSCVSKSSTCWLPFHGQGLANHHKNSAGHEIHADGNRFLAHPFGGGARDRQFVKGIADSAFFDHLGACGQDPRVVDATAHVEHRRDADGAADFFQSFSRRIAQRPRASADLASRRRWRYSPSEPPARRSGRVPRPWRDGPNRGGSSDCCIRPRPATPRIRPV